MSEAATGGNGAPVRDMGSIVGGLFGSTAEAAPQPYQWGAGGGQGGQPAATPSGAHQGVQGIPGGMPVAGRISSGFGAREAPIEGASTFHKGIDIAAPAGTGVQSTADGVVAFAGERGGYGNLVIIDHGNGFETRYGHLQHLGVHTGQTVSAGGMVGTVGSTGISTGNHLHYEVRAHGEAIDPAPTLAGGAAPMAQTASAHTAYVSTPHDTPHAAANGMSSIIGGLFGISDAGASEAVPQPYQWGNGGGQPAAHPHAAGSSMTGRGREVAYPDGTARIDGSRSWRNNNPGNMEYGPFAKAHGAIGSDGHFAVFPNEQVGENARMDLLRSHYGDHSIRGMIGKYAPSFENDTGRYVQAIVPDGATADTKINDLNGEQFRQMVSAMRHHEGWIEGRTEIR